MAAPVQDLGSGDATANASTASPDWTRKYPPLVAALVAIFIAALVLPSALNLPQSNPTETLEYAPVPPDDDNPPPVVGNVTSFGLPSSGSLESDELGQGDGEGDGDAGFDEIELPGKTPSTKRCVGSPPRQTEDPNSPPCVAHFTGDNFGPTYQGVSRTEIKILFYVQGFTRYLNTCRDPNQVTPDGQYFDLAEPEEPGEHCMVRVMRTWMKYFNDRYQTYDRTAHGYVYFSGAGDSPEERRADAADNYSQIRPFAVISTATEHNDAYLEAMAKKKVLNFGSFLGREASFFQKFPRLIWGFPPTLEIQSEMFSQFICNKVQPYKASFGGTPSNPAIPNGAPRKYGMWYTEDKAYPQLVNLAKKVKEQIAACGVTFAVADQRFPSAGYVQDNNEPPTYAEKAVAAFRGAGVTTIIWPGGLETNLSKVSANVGYRPEVVALGDRLLENDSAAGYQEQTFWRQVRMVTNVIFSTRLEDEPCFAAYMEADPSADRTEADTNACPIYDDLRQLFTGIQVAGPRLGPTSIDKGFHAIPKRKSGNRQVPACFYEPGDYTCVKDAMIERWDPDAMQGTNQGCYRATFNGERFLRDGWPRGDIRADEKPDDPCNAYSDSTLSRLGPPNPFG